MTEGSQGTALLDKLNETGRAELAYNAHRRAVEEAEVLAQKVRSCFEALEESSAELVKLGVETHVTLKPPLGEAWAEHRASKEMARRKAEER